MANVSVGSTTGLYGIGGNTQILNNAQTLYNLLANSASVGFYLTNSNQDVSATVLASGVTPSTYGDGTDIPVVTVGADGRITNITTVSIPTQTGTYSNTNVAAYLTGTVTVGNLITTAGVYWANGQPYSTGGGSSSIYGNANVAAYLPTYTGTLNNSTTIIGINANVAGANAALATFEANVGSFYTYANATYATTSGLTAANAAIATLSANVVAFESYANIFFGNLQANAIAQQGQINTINANVSAFETYANLTYATQANLTAFETYANATFGTSNYGNSNVAAYLPTYSGSLNNSSSIITINANVAAFETYANVTYATQANLTAFETYANATFVTSSYGNSNVAAYLPTYSGTLNNSTTIIGINSNVTAANAAIATLTANLSAFETYANITYQKISGAYSNVNVAAYLSGSVTVGNIASTNGFFWANGTPYSTGSGTSTASFTGNLAGNVLYDGINNAIIANAYPFSTPSQSVGGSYYTTYLLQNKPVYSNGVLQPPTATSAGGQPVTADLMSNVALQSNYGVGGFKGSYNLINYMQVWPTTANSMNANDRVRGGLNAVEVNLNGKSWGTNAGAYNTSAVGQQGVASIIGTGSINQAVGAFGQVQVVPAQGSANVAYSSGMFSTITYTANASNNYSISVMGNASLFSGCIAATSGNLTITNAQGVFLPGGWAGTSGINNRYSLRSEDINTVLLHAGNIVLQSGTGAYLVFADGSSQNSAGLTASGLATVTSNFGGNISTVSGNARIAATSQVVDLSVNSGSLNLPIGGNSQRPVTPAPGSIRFNTDRSNPEWYDANDNLWKLFSEIYSPVITYSASYLVVAGGGGGGYSYDTSPSGGGGGAGGLLTGSTTLTIGTTYSVTVGAGGAGGAYSTAATSGTNSSITALSLTAVGGGSGGGATSSAIYAAASCVSGGGGGSSGAGTGGSGGANTAGQGNAGGNFLSNGIVYGGGGGGAGAAGGAPNNIGPSYASNGGAGGAGLSNSITGSAVYYAGGGGGTGGWPGNNYGVGGVGGTGGGGTGTSFTNGGGGNAGFIAGTAGTANTGGGGGGGGNNGTSNSNGLAGGSGVVILSVPTAYYSGTTTGSPTITTSGSNTIITFTASGSYTA